MSSIPDKIRGFVLSKETGRPLPGIVVIAVAEVDNNLFQNIAILVSDNAGYVSFDMKPLIESGHTTLMHVWVYPAFDKKTKIDALVNLSDNGNSGFNFLLAVDAKLSAMIDPHVKLPSIQSPDLVDWTTSPYSLGLKTEAVLGEGDCQTPIPSSTALRDYHFYRIVRKTNVPDGISVDESSPNPIDASIDLSESRNQDNVNNIAYGDLFEFGQKWFPLPHSLGSVIYSLPLAPCESVNLAVIEWSRADTLSRDDEIRYREKLRHTQKRDRSIDETIDAVLDESQGGWSLMGGHSHSASATIPIEGIPVDITGMTAFGGGVSNSWGNRDLEAESIQELHDKVFQSSSVVRSLNSTVIIQATQAETNSIQTRIVTNHNHCHALTVQYYEVLRNFRMVTTYEGKRKVILIPYKLLTFDRKTVLRFITLLQSVLLDSKYKSCFDAMMRLQCEAAYVTASEEESSGGKGPEPTPSIVRYTLKLETGKRSDGNDNTWGCVWVKLINKAGEEKELFFKDSVNSGGEGTEGVPAYSLTGTKVLDIVSGETIGYLPQDISKVKVEWVESNGADAWAFKGIGISYQLSNNQTGVLKINGQDYYSQTPNIQQFDNSGHTHQSWTGLTIAATNPAEDGDKEEPDKAEAPKQKPAFSKVEDECCQKMLLTHLNANIGYYNRAIWFLQDPVERRLLLRIALTDYPHILNGLDDVPLASSGNYVAFAYDDPEKMSRIEKATDDDKINRLEAIVSFPTRGVFAEAQLGHCNSCEKRDVTRFWKWEQSPCEMAPKIEGLTPGPKGQQPTIPQPAQLPQPIIQIAQPLTEPDPVGLAAALKLLGTADIFRDMSTKQEVSKLLDGLVKGTVDIAKAREMANKISSNGGSSSGKGKTTIEAKQAPSESNASDQIDKLDAIQYGKDSGLINEAEASDAATGVLGGGRVLFASADAGFVPDAGSTKKLSGASWVSEFPYSTRLADLEPTFRANVDNFITAVSAAGMNYDVITTYRPKERAYLMHYCCEIIKGTILPKDVPAEAGVDIQWDHGTIADSKRGAQDMFDGYKIDMKQGCPALHTKHQYGTAVDLSVTWTGKPKIKDANGNEIEIVSTATNPANSSNTKLIAVAATYGVIHLIVAGDKNHWSDDGT